MKYLSRKKILLLLLLLSCAVESVFASAVLEVVEDDWYEEAIDPEICRPLVDPLEKFNRKVFAFNLKVDKVIFYPIAKQYNQLLSSDIKQKIDNLLSHSYLPTTIFNNVLQFKLQNTLLGFWRFVINTVFGIGGMYDVARKLGLEVNPQSFGSTLAHYGIGPGFYLVLPFIGATNARDMMDLIVDYKTNILWYFIENDSIVFGRLLLKGIHTRSKLIEISDDFAKYYQDLYPVIRDIAHHDRERVLDYPKCYDNSQNNR